MEIRVPQEVKEIIGKFKSNNYEIYIVGGAVRDLLLNREVSDWDFTTKAKPEEISALFENAFYNNEFGTVGIPSEEFKPHEITTFRTESSYKDSRRPESVEWGESLQEDLERRDFTINAIALQQSQDKPDFFKVIDPFEGQRDIEKKLIRAVGDPHERFGEDALRMMRAVRIAAELNFQIEEKTHDAIKSHAVTINNISKERVRDELLKILSTDHAYEGIVNLKETGLMQEILPELEKTFGVEQKSPGRHHIYDVGTHCLYSLKHCKSDDPIVRFATLIHDIGKPQTYRKDSETNMITFYNHEVLGARIAKNISRRLKFSKKDSEKLFKLVRWHQFTVDEHQTDKAIRRFIKNVGQENVEDMLDLRTGDRLGGGAVETSWRTEDFKKRLIEVQKQPFTVHDLKIKGNDVMEILDIKPSPKIGEILNKLFEDVVEKRVPNEREALIESLKNIS